MAGEPPPAIQSICQFHLKATDLNTYTETPSRSQASYVDTINVFFKRMYPFETIRKLLYLRNRLLIKKYEAGTWVQIQQPSKDDFKFLSSEKPIITRIDFALDKETENSLTHANNLSKILKMRYTRKGYGAHKKKLIKGNTTYYRSKNVTKNVVIYGGRNSKVTGNECVHIEMRLRGSSVIKRNGIDFEQLIAGDVDVEKLFRKALKIERNNFNCHNFDESFTILEVFENIKVI